MGVGSGSSSANESSQPRMNTTAQDKNKLVETTFLLLEAEVAEPSDGQDSEDYEGDDTFDEGIYLGDSDTDEEDSDGENEYEEDSMVEMVSENESESSADEEPAAAAQMVKYGGPERAKESEYKGPPKVVKYEVPRKAIEYEVPRKAIEYAVSERSSDDYEGKQVYDYQTYEEYRGYSGEKEDDDSDSEKECHGYPSEKYDGPDSE